MLKETFMSQPKKASYKVLIQFFLEQMGNLKKTFLLIVFQDCLNCLDSILWPFVLRWVIDIFTLYEANRYLALDSLKAPIFFSLGLLFLIEVNSRTMGFLMAKAVPKLQANIRMTMFDHIQRHSPSYFHERFSGNLVNKISDMTTAVESLLHQLFWPIISSIALSVFGALFLWFVHPIFTFVLLSWIIVHVSISLYFSKSCDIREHRHGEARSFLMGKIVDSLTNYFSVNLFYRFSYEKKGLEKDQQEEFETNVEARRHVETMRSITSFFYATVCFIGINGFVVYLWLNNQISTGAVAQVFATMWNIAHVMWAVGSALPTFFQSFGIAKQAYSVMLDKEDLLDLPSSNPLKVEKGEILFKNVDFQYGEKTLFTNKNVHIRPKEKVGLVGYSGAGKTTFIHLILRFFPLNKGQILIDGHDISEVTLESLRQKIALIPQDPQLFHRTIEENILYGNPLATSDALHKALVQSHADLVVKHLPHGIKTRVGERGTKLSGGEKQRIAIARAILADAPILILDEATSSLDSVTEGAIQDALKNLMANKTTIVIAHRLSTLAHMDRILVFDKGKIVEEGTHDSLLKENGLYKKMWQMQVDGFLPELPQ